MANSLPGGAGDRTDLATAPTAAASSAPPPQAAEPQPDLAARPPPPPPAPATAPKPFYSIFAPRGAAASVKGGRLAADQTADAADDAGGAAASASAAPGPTATESNRSTAGRGLRARAVRVGTNHDGDDGDDDDGNGSVLSLVEDSGDSDADVVVEPRGKGKAVSASKKRAPKAPGAPGKVKGKGKAPAELFKPLPKLRQIKQRDTFSTDEDDDNDDETADSNDDDEPVVLSETGSSSSLLGGGTATLTRSSRSRRSTPVALAPTASGSTILDLTTSPPRRNVAPVQPIKKQTKKKTRATVTPQGPVASSSSASLSSLLRGPGGFAPLAHVYGAAREKRKKSHEGIEPRWPTAQEHLGGWAPPAWARPDRGVGEDLPVATRLDKGKGRQVHANDDQAGIADREGFLVRYSRDIDSTTRTPPIACTAKFRPTASLPFLLPSPLPSHPLLDRLAAPLRNPDSDRGTLSRLGQEANRDSLWTVKYAPQSAEEVLGSTSRQSAGWLKEWLEELKVVRAAEPFANGTKRRRKVARGVDPNKRRKRKKRRHDGLEDFMASSSEEDDDHVQEGQYYHARDLASPPFGSDADLSGDGRDGYDDKGGSRARSLSSSSSAFPSLTNLILLQGPSGSGKSSTVHAVARELGYEVFEVSAGFGRRSAKDLERYVGDAARNHVVNGASPRKGAKKQGGGTLAAMFGQQQKKEERGVEAQATARMTSKEQTPEVNASSGSTEPGPTQSLILIDEVDVFFRHEEDCWAGIAALAAQSRRPIIMTCTDSAHIPLDTLNLQRVVLPADRSTTLTCLPFEAPEPELAIAFLSLVALNEGHVVPARNLARVYDSSTPHPYPAWMLQQQMGTYRRGGGGGYGARPLAPGTSTQPLVSRDMRKALMQLQVECQRGGGIIRGSPGHFGMYEGPVRVPRSRDEVEGEEAAVPAAPISLERAALAAESLSWADACVDTRIESMIEDVETGRTWHPNDVEYSYPILEYLPNPDSTRLPYMGHEHVMADYLRALAYRAWEGGLRFGETQDEKLEAKRAEYTTWFGLITQSGGENAIVQPPGAILPSARPILDVAPLLRHLTRLDDEGERALLEANRAAAEHGARDELDSLAVVGALDSGGATGPGAQIGPRRSTRQRIKQGGGQPVYVRRLPWASEAEANWLRTSGFHDA